MDDDNGRGNRRMNNKRTHSMMAESRSVSPQFRHVAHRSIYDSHYHNEHRSSRPRLELPTFERANLRLPPILERHPRDGLDFRIPVMSQRGGQDGIVDLTTDAPATSRPQRPPRLHREDTQVIEIASSDDETDAARQSLPMWQPRVRRVRQRLGYRDDEATITHSRALRGNSHGPESPLFVGDEEDEIIVTTSRSRPSRDPSAIAGAVETNSTVIDLVSDEEDEELVVTHERNNTTGINGSQPTLAGGAQHSSISGVGHIAGMLAPTVRLRSRFNEHHRSGRSTEAAVPGAALQPTFGFLGFPRHTAREFTSTIFNRLYYGSQQLHTPGPLNTDTIQLGSPVRPVQPREQYEAPPDPADGFTRTPGEDEEVVCPNCGSELALGDSEEQRQVWVIKSCGHAYCGNCVNTRLRSIGKKSSKASAAPRAGQPAALVKCAIPGCAKPVKNTTITRVYMNTD